jgi:hypothetical protein
LLAGFLLGLTVLTHLAYAAFALLGILALFVFDGQSPWRMRFLIGGIVIAGGLIFSSPWWGAMLLMHGFDILVSPTLSHGNLRIWYFFTSGDFEVVKIVLQRFLTITDDWVPTPLGGLGLAGLFYLLLRRRWAIPAWFVAVFLTIGEAKRFFVILGCMAASQALGDLLNLVYREDEAHSRQNLLLYSASLAFLLAFFSYQILRIVRSEKPRLSNSVLEATAWLRDHTALDAQYLSLIEDGDLAEWLPYLSRRTPLVAPWGSEWTGNYLGQQFLGDEIDNCIRAGSAVCLDEIVAADNRSVEYIISPSDLAITGQLAADPGWSIDFQNDQLVIFGKKK